LQAARHRITCDSARQPKASKKPELPDAISALEQTWHFCCGATGKGSDRLLGTAYWQQTTVV
jgi:hypothetical protein